jgi:hypothetical protein
MKNTAQLLGVVVDTYREYKQNPMLSPKSKLKMAKNDMIMVVQQNPNKNSIFAKMAKNGHEIAQVLAKRLPSSDYEYFGVFISDRLFIYGDALKRFFNVNWKDLYKYLMTQNIEVKAFTDGSYKLDAGIDKDTGKYAFYIITDLNRHKSHILVDTSIFTSYMQSFN